MNEQFPVGFEELGLGFGERGNGAREKSEKMERERKE